MSNKIRIAILTNILPIYRKSFYEKIFNYKDLSIKVYCQDSLKGIDLKLIHNDFNNDNIIICRYYKFFNSNFIWQFISLKNILKYDIIFVDGNPRIINHFIYATILRLFNKKIILWSMVHSFNNNRLNEIIRLSWMRFFKYHFLYNEYEMIFLKRKGFSNKVLIPMNNGLDQDNILKQIKFWNEEKLEVWKNTNNIKDIDILTLGRLIPGKYEFLLTALKIIVTEIPNIKCYIIGDGEALISLQGIVSEFNLEKNVKFIGALFNENELAPYLITSKMLVHPTAIGLSLMHAFGYGLPVVTHDAIEFHGPEFSIFKNNENGLSYKNNDINDLVNKIKILYFNEKLRSHLSLNAKLIVTEKYNTTEMAKNFYKLVEIVK